MPNQFDFFDVVSDATDAELRKDLPNPKSLKKIWKVDLDKFIPDDIPMEVVLTGMKASPQTDNQICCYEVTAILRYESPMTADRARTKRTMQRLAERLAVKLMDSMCGSESTKQNPFLETRLAEWAAGTGVIAEGMAGEWLALLTPNPVVDETTKS